MSYLNLAERIRLRFDRKKVGSPTLNSQPGAHTGATRQYIPGYLDINIVWLDLVSGSDANSGATELMPKLTYTSAATAAGSSKKIRIINSGAALTADVTKPTEMKRGLLGTITGTLTTPAATWTPRTSTFSAGETINDCAYSPELNLFLIVGGSGSTGTLATSSDGVTWSAGSTPFVSTDQITCCIYVDELHLFVIGSLSGKIATSQNGTTWTTRTTAFVNGALAFAWSKPLGVLICVGQGGEVISSSDAVNWAALSTGLPVYTLLAASWSDDLELFLIGGEVDTLATSPDGIIWTSRTSGFGGDAVIALAYSPELSLFVAAGSNAKLATSPDGIAWTSRTSGFGADQIDTVIWSPELSLFIIGGGAGKLFTSPDGIAWTSRTSGFGAERVVCSAYSAYLNRFIIGGGDAKVSTSADFAVTISQPVAGFTIQGAKFSGTNTIYNCTFKQIGTATATSLNACRTTYGGIYVSANTQSQIGNLVSGNLVLTGAPSTANAVLVNLNTVSGSLHIFNSSATSYEQLRDNIIEDGLYASYNVIVTSGNIRGTRTNTTITRAVSFSDPVFVDTTDYKLQRVTNGDAQDSPLINASAYYVNEQGQPRDFGAWSYDDSTLPYEYKRSFYLLKPKETGIRPEKQPAASADQGLDGTWDSVNEPTRATEYLTLQYGSGVPVDHITCQDLLESLTDLTCEISLDPQLSDPDSTITVNGNHSIGDVVLNIDASTTIKAGMVLTIGSYKYYILYCYPSTSPTKLILHQALLSSVADNLVITPEEPTTFGTYQYIPQSRQIPRPQSNETEYVNGASFKFVRQYPQL